MRKEDYTESNVSQSTPSPDLSSLLLLVSLRCQAEPATMVERRQILFNIFQKVKILGKRGVQTY